MISDTITQKIGEVMKLKDEIRLSTLRLLSSALSYEFIAKQHVLTGEEELAVVRREVKKRKDAIEALQQAQGKHTTSGSNMDERIKKEEAEMAILEEYLPAQMPDEELIKIVNEAILTMGATSMADMGKVMGVVVPKVAGRADGGRISKLVSEKLQTK